MFSNILANLLLFIVVFGLSYLSQTGFSLKKKGLVEPQKEGFQKSEVQKTDV